MAKGISPSWTKALSKEFSKPYFKSLNDFVAREYELAEVYPEFNAIFRAFTETSIDDIKVVIIGQDPYHGPGQADGLCFSVSENVKIPPSLRNIFKELNHDLALDIPASGNLDHWAKQGVFLLNATLTVQANEAGSHQNKGWEEFTDAVIDQLQSIQGVVFMLWGNFAQKKARKINQSKNLILKSPHPSPLAAHRGFFGNGHFSKANTYLVSNGKRPINW